MAKAMTYTKEFKLKLNNYRHIMTKILIFTILLLLAIACDKKETLPERNEIVGVWEYTSLNVKVNSPDNESGEAEYFFLAENWPKELGITPILTRINDDGTWTNEFYVMPDSTPQKLLGNWEVVRDSIFFKQDGMTTAYSFNIKNNILTFKGLTDFDQDGMKDDDYKGVQKKIQD